MQYGFVPGRGTVDAVFVLRRLGEKFRAKNKFFTFLDLENSFHRELKEFVHFTLSQMGAPESLANGVMSLYEGCKTAVSVDGKLSSSFSVEVAVHQGSALSPLLFVMVNYVLTDVRDGSLIELLNAVEGKGLRVNVDKTKSMQLLFGKKSSFSRVDPFVVCGERVCCNSIKCTKC